VTLSTATGAAATFGTHPITITGATAANYDITQTPGTLSVGTRPVTITAAAKSKTYGENDPALTYAISSGTLAYTDAFTGALARVPGENIGTCAITQGTVALNSNYALNYVGADLTIGTRSVTITAAAKSKTYGEPDPALTYAISSGTLAYTDVFNGALTRVAGENIGIRAITQGTVALNSNYALSYVGADLIIGTRPVTITAAAKSKTYGDPDPALTYAITSGSLAYSDAFTGGLTRVAGDNIGTRAITQGTVALNSNYSLSYVGANLIIGTRPITITAAAKTKYCGQVDPPLTYTLTSGTLVGTDGFSGALTRAAGESTGINYDINQGTVAVSSNYAISYIGANLTITGITIDASASGNPVPLGTSAMLSAKVSPALSGISVVFSLDGIIKGSSLTNNLGVATITVTGLAVDVYKVEAVPGAGCAIATAYLPVYDPNGGFITGGGWINSPVYPALQYMQVSGKANFGFVSKYEKGKTIPTGNTEFQFKEAGMNFSSTSFDWLVISGKKAQYKGTGTINGTGTFGFILTATDGDLASPATVDFFRIKIYNKSTNVVVYDNQYGTIADDADPTTSLGGGSIVIHEVKNGKIASTTPVAGTSPGMNMQIVEPVIEQRIKLAAYPNPFGKQATISFTLPTDEQAVTLDVYDLKGSKVQRMYQGKAAANQTLEFEFNGSNLSPGMYFLRLTTPKKVENFKMIMTE
jgi:hypothetical protein